MKDAALLAEAAGNSVDHDGSCAMMRSAYASTLIVWLAEG